MTIYEKNLDYLNKSHPALHKYLLSAPGTRCQSETAKNGTLTLKYTVNNTAYYLHSKYNPQKESTKIINQIDTSATHIVVLGLGLGYHLSELLKQKSRQTRVLLIEPHPEIAKHSLHTLSWEHLLKREDFHYVIGEDFNQIANIIYPFIDITTFDKIEYLELPSETRLLRPFFDKTKEVIDNEIKTNLYDLKTRLVEGENFLLPRNILKNLPLILQNRPVATLKNKYSKTPGFIISAGPSLDKNINRLKKLKDRGLIIAVDTALKPLLKKSIQPHFTCIGDPSHKNYNHLQGTETKIEHYIAAETGVAHQIFHDFNGKLFTLSVGRPLTKLIETHSRELGLIEGWGSVISIALDMAIYMGLDPIIFVGQDFAFTDHRNHCRGTSWEDSKMENTRNLAELQRFEKKSVTGNKKVIETLDIYGNKTVTSERLLLYKNYLARLTAQHPETRFINATEGGIFTEIPHMPLYQAIKTYVYGQPALDISEVLREPCLNETVDRQRLMEFFKGKVEFFTDFSRKLQEVLGLLADTLQAGDFSPAICAPVLEVCETAKNYLYKEQENGELVEIWTLAPIYNFLKEYRRIEQTEPQNTYIEKSLRLYLDYFEGIIPPVEDIIKRFNLR
ncbi:MAG: motility associated factor glycosyltransferase family protein [bacterium]|nr:motility associated factor glycosyltransferase family protein [bacterium]